MARPLRIEFAGAVYHLTSRGNEKKAIFRDDMDRENFLTILHSVITRYNWLCHAYCLMDNHYHLLIETLDGNLSIGMRQLNGVYTQSFNKRYQRVGHLFQGRFKAVVIQKESHLMEVIRYVVLNPVRAKIVDNPNQWKWSSYLATAGYKKSHPCLTTNWILLQFCSEMKTAEEKYQQFVLEGRELEPVWKDIRAQSVLGDDNFMKTLVDYVKGKQRIPEIAKSQRFINRPALSMLFSDDTLKDRCVRNEQIFKAVQSHGYTQREIADYLGLHFVSISRIMKTRVRMLKK